MKQWLRLGRPAVSVFLAGWALSTAPGFAQDDGTSMEGVRLPIERHESGELKTQLKAETATIKPDGDVRATGVLVEFFDVEGNVTGKIEAEDCFYSRNRSLATSSAAVQVLREGVVITGKGFEWNGGEERIKILENVKVVLARGLGEATDLRLPGLGSTRPAEAAAKKRTERP